MVRAVAHERHPRAAQRRALRRRLRARLGRDPLPSAGIADSQRSKTTGVGGEQRGYDGNKKVRGRKRHLLVDTEGLVLKAKVHSAKVPDQRTASGSYSSRHGAVSRPSSTCGWMRRLRGQGQAVGRGGDGPQRGGGAQAAQAGARGSGRALGKGVGQGRQEDRLAKADGAAGGYVTLPRRWVVERTFSWLSQNRRLSKDYERLCASAEAFSSTPR